MRLNNIDRNAHRRDIPFEDHFSCRSRATWC